MIEQKNMTPRDFLTMLWGEPPPGPVYLFLLPQKRAVWFTHYENLNRLCSAHSDMNIYTGGGMGPRDNRQTLPNRRLTQDEVTGITGLWADLDVAHEVHTKKNLPPTIQAALEILEQAQFEPSLLVDSGHGIQAWWLFDQPWNFESHQENLEARRLTQWWGSYISSLYAAAGWNIDSVHNLDRIMRIPGTFNNKVKSDAKAVAVISNTGLRHSRDAFQELMPPDYQPRTITQGTDASGKAVAVGPENLILDPQAKPDMMKFGELCAEDPRFLRSWEENRTDWHKEADRSASAYDMSLASIAARNGWSDQEICDLLIAKRRHHGQDLKLRQNYYANTIARARQAWRRERAVDEIRELTSHLGTQSNGLSGDDAALDGDVKKMMLAKLCEALQPLEVTRVARYIGPTNSTFVLETTLGDIFLEGARELFFPQRVRDKAFDATNTALDLAFLKKNWVDIFGAIVKAAEDQDLGEISHRDEQTRAWFTDYLVVADIVYDFDLAATEEMPVVNEGAVCIKTQHFLRWAEQRPEIETKMKDLCTRLLRIGAIPDRKNVMCGTHRTTYRFWRLPDEFANFVQDGE